MKRLIAYIAPVALLIGLAIALPAGADMVDRDRDGMADSWEKSYGLRVGVQDGGGDPDNDKLTNHMEYQHRSDPRDPLSPGRHFVLGALVTSPGNQGGDEAIRDFEKRINRKIEVRRSFNDWNDDLGGLGVERDVENGRLPFIGWKAEIRHEPVKWTAIANGRYDDLIRRQANHLRRLEAPILMNFHHEPENDVGRRNAGSAGDYRAAWRRVVTLFRQEDAHNVRFAMVLMSSSYRKDRAARYYPGSSYIDYIGSNFFNAWPAKRGVENRSFKEGLAPFYKWGTSRGKPLVIGTFGAQEHPDQPGHRARWLRNAAETLKGWPAVRLACYFDSSERFPYSLYGRGLRAFRKIADEQYFRATELR